MKLLEAISSHLNYLKELKQIKSDSYEKEKIKFNKFWEEDPSQIEYLLSAENYFESEIDGTSDKLRNAVKGELSFSTLEFKKYLLYNKKLRRGLRMKDRASMKNSIELRVPFVDKEVIKHGLTINSKNNFHNGISKAVIRKIGYSLANENVFYKKKNINAPQSAWLVNKYDEVESLCMTI